MVHSYKLRRSRGFIVLHITEKDAEEILNMNMDTVASRNWAFKNGLSLEELVDYQSMLRVHPPKGYKTMRNKRTGYLRWKPTDAI